MAVKVFSRNLNKKRRINLAGIDKAAVRAMRLLGIKNGEINIVFVGNPEIRALNRRYLGEDVSTDVLAFPGSDELHGDIAISTDTAASNAKVYGEAFKRETARYVIHGILHLAGYLDETAKGRKKMREKEDELLGKIEKYI